LIHTAAWLIWLAAALAALSATRNPLYLLLLWLCLLVVGAVLQRRAEAAPAPFSLLRFSVVVIALAALFNAFTSHMGESVLLTIPGRLPLLSGTVTWEGLVYGAINGLALAGLLAAFGVLNRAVPVRALVRLIPRAFYPVAVVTAIAVTYVPVTVRQFRQVREAQAVRGHRLRGLRGWLPLLMPLLVGGLERALALAEAMTARGFASQPVYPAPRRAEKSGGLGRCETSPQSPDSIFVGQAPAREDAAGGSPARLALLGGVVCLAGGWLLLFSGAPALLQRGLILAGVLLIGAGLWALGRRWPRTTYRHEPWRAADSLVCLGALLALAAFLLPLPGLERASLGYSPYPRLALPGFDLRLAALALGLLVPALVGRKD